jgi:hypothetical protein
MCTYDSIVECLADVVMYNQVVCGKADEELVFYVYIVLCLHDGINVCLVDAFFISLCIQKSDAPA